MLSRLRTVFRKPRCRFGSRMPELVSTVKNQVSTTNASKDRSELDGHMCRRPERITADCHVPGNIPVKTKRRRGDSYNGGPDVPRHTRDLDVVPGLGQFGSRCRYRRGPGHGSPWEGKSSIGTNVYSTTNEHQPIYSRRSPRIGSTLKFRKLRSRLAQRGCLCHQIRA
jgi:hypothetical protein